MISRMKCIAMYAVYYVYVELPLHALIVNIHGHSDDDQTLFSALADRCQGYPILALMDDTEW